MAAKLDLVFLWHMHQPDYRLRGGDGAAGEYVLPWVYLHAIKDYTDMVAHLERHPGVRAVVNFVPTLVEQIEDYVDQYRSGRMRDPLLRLLALKLGWVDSPSTDIKTHKHPTPLLGGGAIFLAFAAGLVFGLRGTIERVTNKVFLLSPANVDVGAEARAQIAQDGFFNQS